jgi:hypothetical protein
MMNDKEQAKKIFFDYACNHFFMAHNGVDKQYKEFHITDAEEKGWRKEYIAFWIERLSTGDLFAIQRLNDAWAREALPNLIEMVDKEDGLAKLYLANTIWDLASYWNDPASLPSLREQAIGVAVGTWKGLIAEPVAISAEHIARVTPDAMRALDASTPEEYIKNYAESKLREYEKWRLSPHKDVDVVSLLQKEKEKIQSNSWRRSLANFFTRHSSRSKQ